MVRVFSDGGCYAYAALLVDFREEGKGRTTDPAASLGYLALLSKPEIIVKRWDVFYETPLESQEISCGETCIPESLNGLEPLLCSSDDCCSAGGQDVVLALHMTITATPSMCRNV